MTAWYQDTVHGPFVAHDALAMTNNRERQGRSEFESLNDKHSFTIYHTLVTYRIIQGRSRVFRVVIVNGMNHLSRHASLCRFSGHASTKQGLQSSRSQGGILGVQDGEVLFHYQVSQYFKLWFSRHGQVNERPSSGSLNGLQTTGAIILTDDGDGAAMLSHEPLEDVNVSSQHCTVNWEPVSYKIESSIGERVQLRIQCCQ
jgi:hypothetical protein